MNYLTLVYIYILLHCFIHSVLNGCGNDCPQAFKNVKLDYQLDWDCFGGKPDIRWNKIQ